MIDRVCNGGATQGFVGNISNKLTQNGRKLGLAAGLVIVATWSAGCQPQVAETPEANAGPIELTDDMAKASYSLGFTVSENVTTRFGEHVNHEAFLAGVEESLAGSDPRVDEDAAREALMAMNNEKSATDAKAAEGTKAAGIQFLADNAQKEGVVTLDSGLQYEVLTAAEGDKPAATDTVTTHYEGRLLDGTVFDSSVARGEPASFPLNRVIPGWTEALQLMSVGAKWRLYIPSELAYGNRATGSIPAESTLMFDVELLEIAE